MRRLVFSGVVAALLSSQAVVAENIYNGDHCVGTASGMQLDDEFGAGTQAVTRCLKHNENVRVLFQMNQLYKNSKNDAPYAAENILNALEDYSVTHGIKDGHYEVVVVAHSEGWRLMLDNVKLNAKGSVLPRNPFQAQIQELMNKGVKIYFCLNTMRSKGVVKGDLIDGIEFVTSGVTAIPDFQRVGFQYVQP